jgi:anti-sigma regulatory factor (Ser/Thr protein kinase)
MSAASGPHAPALEIQADPYEFRRASSWLRTSSEELAVPGEQIDRLELCLNEVLANLLEHGGAAVARHPIQLHLEAIRSADVQGARLVVMDRGEPFDSPQASLKPLPTSLGASSPGGLGLRLVKTFSDAMAYQVQNGHNELRIELHWLSGC